ncbi:hypothetical protein EBT16_04400 [bacterium]|nr:hypothetical protein [bacterium]
MQVKLLSLFFLAGILQAGPIPREVEEVVPKNIDIHSAEYVFARREILELIEACGPGVFQGVSNRKEKNRCSFEVALDADFFLPPWMKTGLLPEEDWAYQDGVVWVQPKPVEVPENFDLRDLMFNGVPEIKKQNCGDCWAWSTHHGLEISRAVHDQEVHDHSIQTVLSCSDKGSCNGGYMSAVGFLAHGLPYEEQFPYSGNNARCKYSEAEIEEGWDGKIISAPYIGSSKDFSRSKQTKDGIYRATDLKEMTQAMVEWKAPLVVTVAAYNLSGPGVYDECSAVNSGGNHMVAIVGWELWQEKLVAHVWNSWGKKHGQDGVSRILWDCGKGRLNRGLGVSARVVQYKAQCQTPYPAQKAKHVLTGEDNGVEIGLNLEKGTQCSWLPKEGLEDPESCQTTASPNDTTEYHLTAKNECGTASSMTLVEVKPPRGHSKTGWIKTPFGKVKQRN